MPPGFIFFDNNTLGEIRRRGLSELIVRSLRSVDLEAQATEINLVESYAASETIADALIATLRALVGRDAVLPWTGEILQLEAQAFLRGDAQSQIPLNSLETLEPGETRTELRARLNTFRKRTDESHRRLHARTRPHIQRKLKERGIKPDWAELPAFLEAWQTLDVRLTFAKQSWRDLELPEPFEPGVLEASESWRLMSDADAAAMFQAAIAFQQPMQVQRMDQLQLPYLGGAYRRVLVTRDGAFADVAKTIVNGRYYLARVLTFSEFLDTAGIDVSVVAEQARALPENL